MDKRIEEELKSLYNFYIDKPNKVLSIFEDFYGEDRVDMQGCIPFETFKYLIGEMVFSLYIPESILKVQSSDISDLCISKIDSSFDTSIIIEGLKDETSINYIGNTLFNDMFILVYYPRVKVTNENDKYTYIDQLYAKVHITYKGNLKYNFTLNRAEYSYIQFKSNYLHSHVSEIPKNDFTEFKHVCTGTGPINNTILTLTTTSDFNENIWKLFCLELDKYIQTESLTGGPYYKLENIGKNNAHTISTKFYYSSQLDYFDELNTLLQEFIPYFIKEKKLQFNYINNNYYIGMSNISVILTISNSFIEWYNQKISNDESVILDQNDLFLKGILRKCYIDDNSIRDLDFYYDNENIESYIGEKVCTFKGKDVLLNIINIKDTSDMQESIILDIKIISYILTKILFIINYKYGTNNANSEITKSDKRTRYL